MKQTLATILCFLFSTYSIAQIVFEKGYFIKNSGERIECLIKNKDWKDNPNNFEYKRSQDSEVSITSLKEASEFGVYERSKFKRFNIGIDRSSSDLNDMSYERVATIKKEILFLRVLTEGASNLFSYEDHNMKRFFYNVGQNDVEQLVYKLYKNDDEEIGENRRYRQQLMNSLKNDCISINQLKNIGYYEKEMINLFVKYNDCNSDSKSTSYLEKKLQRDTFNLTLRPGINSSSMSIDPPNTLRDAEFDNELSLRFGVEIEYVLPFNKNKWAIILEPTFQSYKSKTIIRGLDNPSLPLDRTFIANYKSIELPLGIRHSFYLSKKTKLFINTSYVIDLDIDSGIEIGLTSEFDENKVKTEINSRSNFAFGIGLKYAKFSTELRYGLNREVLGDLIFWDSSYQTTSLIFGYSLF